MPDHSQSLSQIVKVPPLGCSNVCGSVEHYVASYFGKFLEVNRGQWQVLDRAGTSKYETVNRVFADVNDNDAPFTGSLAKLVKWSWSQKISEPGDLSSSFHQAFPLADQTTTFPSSILFAIDAHTPSLVSQTPIREVSVVQLPSDGL